MIDIFETVRKPLESEQDMIWRIGSAKNSGELDATWDEVAGILNREFRPDEPYQSSAYRKQFQIANLFFESVFSKQIGGDSYMEQMREERQELYKVKTQVRDERNELGTESCGIRLVLAHFLTHLGSLCPLKGKRDTPLCRGIKTCGRNRCRLLFG